MSESLLLAAEVWSAVKEHVIDVDTAASDIVNALIDNTGLDVDSILNSELGTHAEIKTACSAYLVDDVVDDDEGVDEWGDEIEEDDADEDDY